MCPGLIPRAPAPWRIPRAALREEAGSSQWLKAHGVLGSCLAFDMRGEALDHPQQSWDSLAPFCWGSGWGVVVTWVSSLHLRWGVSALSQLQGFWT